jgi:hypothetical protein
VFLDFSNFAAGMGDKVSFGLTQQFRAGCGYDDVVDKTSLAYGLGSAAGQLVNTGLMVAGGAASGVLGTVEKGLQVAGVAVNTYDGVMALKDGNILGALTSFMAVGLAASRGVSSCARISTIAQVGQQALHGTQAATLIVSSFGKFDQGDYFGGFADLVDAGANLYMMTCFAGDMYVLTKRGWIRWDRLTKWDEVASCDEHDPKGQIVFKRVRGIVRNLAKIWHVQVKGRHIRTTAEHPIFVWGKGFVPAHAIQSGDRFRSNDGRMVAVEKVYETDAVEMVYNCVVEDYHTYFVAGGEHWGFSVWAHNTCWKPGDDIYSNTNRGTAPSDRTVIRRFWRNEANSPSRSDYVPSDFARMKQGKPPQKYNADKGAIESMEASHEPLSRLLGGRQMFPRWPQEHAIIDPQRRPGY